MVEHEPQASWTPMRVFKWISTTFAILSIAGLIAGGLRVSFVSVCGAIFEYYDNSLGMLIGWLEQPLNDLLAALGLSLGLQPEWHHYFVVLCLLTGLVVRFLVRNIPTYPPDKRLRAALLPLPLPLALVVMMFAPVSNEWALHTVFLFGLLGWFELRRKVRGWPHADLFAHALPPILGALAFVLTNAGLKFLGLE